MAKTEIIQLSAVTDAGMLRDAAKLVRRGWTTAYGARSEDGSPLDFSAPGAVRFCLVGALNRAILNGLGGNREIIYTELYTKTFTRLINLLDASLAGTLPNWKCSRLLLPLEGAIADWNDNAADQNTVVAVLDKAATLALAPASPTKHERD